MSQRQIAIVSLFTGGGFLTGLTLGLLIIRPPWWLENAQNELANTKILLAEAIQQRNCKITISPAKIESLPVPPTSSIPAPQVSKNITTINPLENTLAYLKDILEIKWYEIDNNTVYLGFAILSDHCYILTDAAALDAHYATQKECHAWAINATHKGWRPDTTSVGKGPLYGRAVAKNGHLLQSSKAAHNIAERKAQVFELVKLGFVHSLNPELHQVRVDPIIWVQLPIEAKQGYVILFSRYFEDNGKTGYVTILSNQKDQKLATYSSWSGMKILE